MKFKLLRKAVFVLFLLIPVLSFSQRNDTIFYGKKNIRSIETKKKKDKVLIAFFSIEGENLLVKDNFKYSYFDSIMGKIKIVLVQNKSIYQEYWISGNDTLYDKAKLDVSIDKQVKKFQRYLNNNLIYPQSALTNRVQGRVFLSMIVNKEGEITQIKPISDLGYGLEESAIETVRKFGKWGYVTINNKVVNCYFRFPVIFVL